MKKQLDSVHNLHKLDNFLHVVILGFTTKELVYEETFENHKQ